MRCLFTSWVLLFVAAVAGAEDVSRFETRRDVAYAVRAATQLRADVYQPSGRGPFPAVLLVHGGAWRAGNKSHMARYAADFASHGFVCVSIDYRLAPEFPFPAQIEDCKSAVRWMRRHGPQYRIDPQRIGVLGYSAGGHLAALLGTTDATAGLEGPDALGISSRVQCVVAGGAPVDFRLLLARAEGMSFWLGGSRGEKPDAYDAASPLKFVSADDPPMLFIHGDSDRLVPIMGPRRMIQSLSDAGVPASLYLVREAGHVQAFADEGARRQAREFLSRHLRPEAPGN